MPAMELPSPAILRRRRRGTKRHSRGGAPACISPRGFEFLAGPRLKVVPLVSAPTSVAVGIIACRTGKLSTTVEHFFPAVIRSTMSNLAIPLKQLLIAP